LYVSVVLNERQRTAKRRLIEENRERRKEEQETTKPRLTSPRSETLTDQDRGLICEVVTAYEYTAGKIQNNAVNKVESFLLLHNYETDFI